MPLHPRTCTLLYSVSCLLDALDGLAARRFEQSTKFGAVLDMVTDRCTTACLLVFLASAFPRWSIIFQGLISLDLASHYMHMYATLSMGGSGTSHKKVDESRSWVLKMYYSNQVCSHCPSFDVWMAGSSNQDLGCLLTRAGRSLHLLRPERTVFHCPLPPLLLLALPLPHSPWRPRRALFPTTRHPRVSKTIHAVRQPLVCGCDGNGTVSTTLNTIIGKEGILICDE
jgi:hypothetical protein